MSVAGAPLLAAAKVNLALHVTGRRPDGYHLLDSIAVFADVGDRLEIAPASALQIEVSGPFAAHAPADATDLAWRAAVAYFARLGKPAAAAIRVEKNIPAGAGLGGGSADAAAVLAGLQRRFAQGVPPEELRTLALTLGADVPMCLVGRALRARGIGEDIEPLPGVVPLPLVLVWPATGVSTARVFGALSCRENTGLSDMPAIATPAEAARWLAGCRNDLEPPAVEVCPAIGAVLEALRAVEGCLLARMSGSGSACFGIFPDAAQAEAAARNIAAAHPEWWCVATMAR